MKGFNTLQSQVAMKGHSFGNTGNCDHDYDKHKNPIIMLTFILVLAALICFAIFFKSIDFFDKI